MGWQRALQEGCCVLTGLLQAGPLQTFSNSSADSPQSHSPELLPFWSAGQQESPNSKYKERTKLSAEELQSSLLLQIIWLICSWQVSTICNQSVSLFSQVIAKGSGLSEEVMARQKICGDPMRKSLKERRECNHSSAAISYETSGNTAPIFLHEHYDSMLPLLKNH